ncbi:STAS/SEC14 domain-containing protein [Corallococcus praedator]|uniref:STAS/SEC14 domain-containing protein n=1 Tax=Corallococcus praedator TaxID=2316724 RepID=A0ABX9QBA6_9BACT|nr:STAS/SEC14 domain-containing protein [Corallococcus sp. CA047B]RKH22210.1 STAS/SEC14 domain-containing protein [Corallococcus sp. CA031C]RKH95140.1 STAS/SEC14 domain-containing protein [Corallococcus praedator]
MSLESSDVLWATIRGTFSEEEVHQLMGVLQELHAQLGGPFYLVVDLGSSMGPMTDGTALPLAPRKYLAEHVRPEWFRAVVFFGGKRSQREVLRALVVALQFTGRTRLNACFLETRKEAREWLDAHRERHALPPAGPLP